jgi:hypothetical protein
MILVIVKFLVIVGAPISDWCTQLETDCSGYGKLV